MYFDAQRNPELASDCPSKLAMCPVHTHTPAILELFLTFWHKMFQAHRVLSFPQPWSQPFLQGVLVPFTGEGKTFASLSRML